MRVLPWSELMMRVRDPGILAVPVLKVTIVISRSDLQKVFSSTGRMGNGCGAGVGHKD